MLTARLETLGLGPGTRLLDVGCGEGRHVHGVHLLGLGTAIGVDMDEASLAKAKAGLATLPGTSDAAFLRGSAYALPFADGAFDAVVCSEVLEHLADYPAALAEMARVLRPGGRFVATVPRAWPERICWRLAPGTGGYADQPGGHVRIFDEPELVARVVANGLRPDGRHHAHALHTPYWWLKTAFWHRRDDHPLVRLWHRLLVWDMMARPRSTRLAERLLNPLIGKSLVLYFVKPA